MKKLFNNIGKTEIRNILAVMIVCGCFILLYLMQIKPVPTENQGILNVAIGFVFGGALAGVVGYYFGSSKTETDKNITTKSE